MRTLKILRGCLYLLDPPDPWPPLCALYESVGTTRHALPASAPPSTQTRRAGVRNVCQTCGFGQWVAILGATFEPAEGPSLELEVVEGVESTLEADLVKVILEGLIEGLRGVPLPPGRLRVDRATVHPVDRQPWAFRSAARALALALLADLDEATLTEKANQAFARRTAET